MTRWRDRLRALPLRWTLVAALVGLCAVGLVASSAAVTTALRDSMVARIDSQLSDAAHTWAQPQPGGPHPPPPPGEPSSSRPPSPFYVQVRGPDGTIEFTVNDSGAAPDAGADTGLHGPVTVGSAGSGPRWRVLSTARPSGGRTVVGMSLG